MWRVIADRLLLRRVLVLAIGPAETAGDYASHRMGGLVPTQRARQIVLDLLLRLAAILLAELHANARRALALCTLRRHPDHAPGHRQLLVFAHEVEQHEHLVAEAVVAVGWNEQTAVADERHVSEVQRALVL